MSINATQSHSREHLMHGLIFVCNPEIDIQVDIYEIMLQVTMQPVILFIELYIVLSFHFTLFSFLLWSLFVICINS